MIQFYSFMIFKDGFFEQLSSSLATLLALLREAGLNASELPEVLPLAEVATTNEVEDEELTADEV